MNIVKIIHNVKHIVSIEGIDFRYTMHDTIGKVIFEIASKNKNRYILWVHESLTSLINEDFILSNMSERKMLSFKEKDNYISKNIGFIDESIFINVNKKVTYPTWQMSSEIGIIATNFVIQTERNIWTQNQSFDFILNAVAKLYQPLGLFCYSEPNLLLSNYNSIRINNSSNYELFVFVKKYYKWVWVYILVLNYIIYLKKFPILPFFNTFFYKKYNTNKLKELEFSDQQKKINVSDETIDVIIPTIGRKKYLYDVLKDLSVQTHLPKNVIIVEQNPDENSVSELDYLTSEPWPFHIKHVFTHQTGACQARNIALDLVVSKWVFFNDDDNQFDKNLLQSFLNNSFQFHNSVFTCSYLQKKEKLKIKNIIQFITFGSGNSFIKACQLKNIRFNLSFEFGYGEDADFGMQLRNAGIDVIYLPEPSILHLKAPIGGFRTKPKLLWDNELIPPKPSPTVMLFHIKYKTKEQLLGYKTNLFLKYYKKQNIKNPISYFYNFNKQWNISIKWANNINKENEI